jgi:CHAD domain-containing protein
VNVPESSLAYVLAAIKREVDALRAEEAGVRRGRSAEAVHRMRTALRRLRSILRTGRPLFRAGWVDRLRGELKWLGAALGGVRDLDVLAAHLRSRVGPMPAAERAAARRLLRRLRDDRGRARRALLTALRSPRYARLRHQLTTALDHPPTRRESISLVGITADTFRKLRKAVGKLPDDPDDEDLHRVRIKVKRARYAAELVQPTEGRRGKRFIKAAKEVQDILGEHQDAVVAEAYVRRAADQSPAIRPVRARLVEHQRDRRERAREAFDETWPRLARRGRKAWREAPDAEPEG